jgi:hypothetical protein
MTALEIRPEEIGQFDLAAYRERRARMTRAKPVAPEAPKARIINLIPARVHLGREIYVSPIGPLFIKPERDILDLKRPLVPNRRKDIAKEVAAKHGLTIPVLLGKSRQADIVIARRELVYRLFTELGMSLASIGKFMNQADHTSARYALKTVRAQLARGEAPFGLSLAAE